MQVPLFVLIVTLFLYPEFAVYDSRVEKNLNLEVVSAFFLSFSYEFDSHHVRDVRVVWRHLGFHCRFHLL